MKISYIEDNGKKYFSFSRHDLKKTPSGKFIDGGFNYGRANTNIKEDTIENLIEDIREQFVWTIRLNKDNTLRDEPEAKLLKDLDTDHIINILIYFTDKAGVYIEDTKENYYISTSWIGIHMILLQELKYRYANNIY